VLNSSTKISLPDLYPPDGPLTNKEPKTEDVTIGNSVSDQSVTGPIPTLVTKKETNSPLDLVKTL